MASLSRARSSRVVGVVLAWSAFLILSSRCPAAEFQSSAGRLERDLAYRAESETRDDAYARERCKLDLYLPTASDRHAGDAQRPPTPLVIWFHGGGLTGGKKDGDTKLFDRMLQQGWAVASVEYRLSPKVKYPVYLQDAAQAVAWCLGKAESYHFDTSAIFVAGHSAGGYLTAMLAMDESLLRAAGVAPGAIAGFIPVSGQMLTHYAIRDERNLGHDRPMADSAAPVFHARQDAPPLLVLVGDHDMPMRLEENTLFAAAMKDVAHSQTTQLVIVKDRTHGSIASKLLTQDDPAGEALVAFVKKFGVARPEKTANH